MNHRSVIFDTTVRVVFDAAIVLSLYLLFAGHNQPGGGFVGGLVAAAALALRYLAGGIDEVRPLLPVGPGRCCRPGSPWPRARPSGRSSPVTRRSTTRPTACIPPCWAT